MFRYLFFCAFIVCQLLAIIPSNICRNLNYPMTTLILPQIRHKVKFFIYIISMKAKMIIKNLLIILFPLIGGILISLFTNSKSYKVINKPPLSPPGIIFPIVWTILYLLMGISFLISSKVKNDRQLNRVFITQLIINYVWPILFFSIKAYTFSVVWLIILLTTVIDMIVKLYNNKKIAGILQFPYFIWLLFALYLNIGVAILN